MNLKSIIAFAAFAAASVALAQDKPAAAPAPETKPAQAAPAAAVEYCVFRTTKGDIVMELDRAKAPISVENFVQYIKDGHYDATVFHRVISGFMIQGGGFTADGVQRKTRAGITNEWQNGLKNVRGAVAFARLGGQPNSATSQFFINHVNNPSLDQARQPPNGDGAAYAVFGKVVVGMDVVDAIAKSPTASRKGMGNWPVEDITVNKAEMISKEEAAKFLNAKPAVAPAAPTAPAAPAAPVAPAAPAAPKGTQP